MALRARKVDGIRWRETICSLHDECFGDSAPQINPSDGHWWLVFDGAVAVAFSGVVQSTLAADVGYFKRVGVTSPYRGRGLQVRLLRVCEAHAKRIGWTRIISDTTYDNIASANSFIRSGYRLFEPPLRWAFRTGLYWSKDLSRHGN